MRRQVERAVRLNQRLLETALSTLDSDPGLVEDVASVIAEPGKELERDEWNTSDAVAGYTGRLFSCIARLSAEAAVHKAIARVNDELRHIRTLEHEQLDDVAGELIEVCELPLAERFDKVAEAAATYHARRPALLPRLLDRLGK